MKMLFMFSGLFATIAGVVIRCAGGSNDLDLYYLLVSLQLLTLACVWPGDRA